MLFLLGHSSCTIVREHVFLPSYTFFLPPMPVNNIYCLSKNKFLLCVYNNGFCLLTDALPGIHTFHFPVNLKLDLENRLANKPSPEK